VLITDVASPVEQQIQSLVHEQDAIAVDPPIALRPRERCNLFWRRRDACVVETLPLQLSVGLGVGLGRVAMISGVVVLLPICPVPKAAADTICGFSARNAADRTLSDASKRASIPCAAPVCDSGDRIGPALELDHPRC
jgi:hypothetical protein